MSAQKLARKCVSQVARSDVRVCMRSTNEAVCVWYGRPFTKYPETPRITQSREDSICLCACAEQTRQFREHQGSS